ncbi:ABC transporter substrate-binding protein [Candidatus Lokiarchaeum ossiferum]|uniref:ABC transporter substrate-binding protein n=1 Tax=Candidatus Lokiarchaeum ossiferum TaxID=2951803 RepID=UPI00352F592B
MKSLEKLLTPRISNKKKLIVLSSIFVLIILTWIPIMINPLNAIKTEYRTMSEEPIPFLYGHTTVISNIDPHFTNNPEAINLIFQVCEGLYVNKWNGSEFNIENQLTTRSENDELGMWSEDMLNFTVNLKHEIYFHDGSSFNASVVKWNFDRLSTFLQNTTGNYPEFADLYYFTNEFNSNSELIINRTEIVNNFQIRFVLNTPYSNLTDLLCHSSATMMSPQILNSDTLNKSDTLLVGTGPYLHEFSSDMLEIFSYNPLFSDIFPDISEMHWILYDDPLNLNLAMQSGDIEMIRNPSFNQTQEGFFDITPTIDSQWNVAHFSWTSNVSCNKNGAINFYNMGYLNQQFPKCCIWGINYYIPLVVTNIGALIVIGLISSISIMHEADFVDNNTALVQKMKRKLVSSSILKCSLSVLVVVSCFSLLNFTVSWMIEDFFPIIVLASIIFFFYTIRDGILFYQNSKNQQL